MMMNTRTFDLTSQEKVSYSNTALTDLCELCDKPRWEKAMSPNRRHCDRPDGDDSVLHSFSSAMAPSAMVTNHTLPALYTSSTLPHDPNADARTSLGQPPLTP